MLVAYASRNGSTAEIAETIGKEMELIGIEAVVMPAEDVPDVRPFDAVILGSSVYAWRWEKSAVDFARRNAANLRSMPVWLFSSGPLDWSADKGELKPVRGARKIAELVGAVKHITFGGKLPPGNSRLMQKMASKGEAGADFRNFGRIREWADEISAQVRNLLARKADEAR